MEWRGGHPPLPKVSHAPPPNAPQVKGRMVGIGPTDVARGEGVMGELSVWHWLIVVLVFALLFGAKRLPDTARSLGQALRLFKQETSRLRDDDAEEPRRHPDDQA
ncbi:MAG: tatA [Sphaerisporangium sp.]|nr:tatA [Sphaerisporangium sp.]